MSCRCEEKMKKLGLVDFLIASAKSYSKANNLPEGVLPKLLDSEALTEMARELNLKVEIISSVSPRPEGLDCGLKNPWSKKEEIPIIL